jgi:predicted nucleotidyltransferase
MLDPVKLETIITQYKNITLQDNIIGYAITGSSLLGLADQQSDTDLILITKGN